MSLLQKIARYRDFYRRDHGLMVHIVSGADPFERMPKLAGVDWKDEDAVKPHAREKLAFVRECWRSRETIADDYIPSIQVLAGTGMVAAALLKDADLTLEADTNYLVDPQLGWDEDSLGRVGFDPDNPWFKAQLWMLEAFLEDYDGSYGILPFTHFDPLDLANQYRGNALFLDLELYPDELSALLARCGQAILDLESYLWSHPLRDVPLPGRAIAGLWIPAGNYLSCDAGDLISPEHLRRFGIPYATRIVEAWGGAYLHHHELGRHQIDTWAAIPRLTIQFLNRDFNTRHLGECMEDGVIASSRILPVQFIATADEFLRHADRWAQGKFVVVITCRDERDVAAVQAKRRQLG